MTYASSVRRHMPSAPTAARQSPLSLLPALDATRSFSSSSRLAPSLPANRVYQHLRRHQNIPTSTEARQPMPSTPNSNIKHITHMDHNSKYIIRGFCPFFFGDHSTPLFLLTAPAITATILYYHPHTIVGFRPTSILPSSGRTKGLNYSEAKERVMPGWTKSGGILLSCHCPGT